MEKEYSEVLTETKGTTIARFSFWMLILAVMTSGMLLLSYFIPHTLR